jgi:hypothetical protein
MDFDFSSSEYFPWTLAVAGLAARGKRFLSLSTPDAALGSLRKLEHCLPIRIFFLKSNYITVGQWPQRVPLDIYRGQIGCSGYFCPYSYSEQCYV